jgi:hypothetical protein
MKGSVPDQYLAGGGCGVITSVVFYIFLTDNVPLPSHILGATHVRNALAHFFGNDDCLDAHFFDETLVAYLLGLLDNGTRAAGGTSGCGDDSGQH